VTHTTKQFDGHDLTDTNTSWWRHSRSAETFRRLYVYCVHISAYV